jgi:membrane-associated protease RseP (regulator of RpoE activity)
MRRVVLSVLALTMSAPLAAQQPSRPAGAPADTVRLRASVVLRDSQVVRTLTTGNEAEVLRVVNELRERESRILRELARTPLARTDTRRSLEEDLARVSREAFTVMSVIESRCLEERATAPNGYLGVNLTSEVEVRDRIVVVQRSMITSVEPGSPAQRAGLASGDRLLSIGGRDARERMPQLAGLLEPGRRIEVRVERDGTELEIPVVVAQRPQRFDQGCPQFERAIQPLRMGGMARVWVHDSADGRGNRVMYLTEPAAPMPPVVAVRPTPAAPATPATSPSAPARPATAAVPAPPSPAAAPAAPSVFVFGSTSGGGSQVAYFAGAQFRELDDDWREVLGLRSGTQGVLVNEVARGSAAAQSGLKVGDVITQVGAAAATSPFVVSRLLGLNENQQATLQVLRKRQPERITLRWDSPMPRR